MSAMSREEFDANKIDPVKARARVEAWLKSFDLLQPGVYDPTGDIRVLLAETEKWVNREAALVDADLKRGAEWANDVQRREQAEADLVEAQRLCGGRLDKLETADREVALLRNMLRRVLYDRIGLDQKVIDTLIEHGRDETVRAALKALGELTPP